MKRVTAIVWLLLFPALVAGGEPEVIQLSPDTYMITKTDHSGIFGGGLPKLKGAVIKQANEFAASQGKIAIPLGTSEQPMAAGQFASFEYQFRVVDKNDPEARRTSLTPRADTVISIEGLPAAPVAAPVAAQKETDRVDDLYSKLIKLDDLRARGLITDDEFQAEKRKLLEK